MTSAINIYFCWFLIHFFSLSSSVSQSHTLSMWANNYPRLELAEYKWTSSTLAKETCTMEYDSHLICKIRLKLALAFLINSNNRHSYTPLRIRICNFYTNQRKYYSSAPCNRFAYSNFIRNSWSPAKRRAPTFNRCTIYFTAHFSALSHQFNIISSISSKLEHTVYRNR